MLGLAGVLVVIGGLLTWHHYAKSDGSEESLAAPVTTESAPAPAPEALLAEITIGTPNASWSRLQRTIGGTLGILPSTAGGILCLAAGLDPLLASEIDGMAPAFAVVAGDAASPHFLYAMKLSDLRKSRAALVDGETARFGSREVGGMTELVPKSRERPQPGLVLGIAPNGYLLLASASDDLARLGPYVTRTLPKRPLPTDGAIVADVPRGALGTLVKPKLQDGWDHFKEFLLSEDERMRRNHGGRPPDFGDPKAIVAAVDGWVGKRIAIVADLDRLHAVFDVTDDGVALSTSLSPQATGPAAEWTSAMVVGDTAALAALPANAALALSVRDSEADRQAQADGVEKLVVDALGPRFADADKPKLHAAATDFTKARGDVLAASLVWDEPQGLALRVPVRDPEAATRAAKESLDLLSSAPLKLLLRARDVTTKTEEAPGLGKVQMATISREPRPGPPPRGGDAGAGAKGKADELGVASLVEGGTLTLAAGELPLFTLNGVVHPSPKLGDDRSVSKSLAALGTGVNAVVVAQPLRLDPMRANLPTAPLLLALSRKDRDAVVRIEVANTLLRELARSQLGL